MENMQGRLVITTGISGEEQESSFMNATINTVGNNLAFSIAIHAPESASFSTEEDIVAKVRKDFQPLVDCGWNIEIQVGPSETIDTPVKPEKWTIEQNGKVLFKSNEKICREIYNILNNGDFIDAYCMKGFPLDEVNGNYALNFCLNGTTAYSFKSDALIIKETELVFDLDKNFDSLKLKTRKYGDFQRIVSRKDLVSHLEFVADLVQQPVTSQCGSFVACVFSANFIESDGENIGSILIRGHEHAISAAIQELLDDKIMPTPMNDIVMRQIHTTVLPTTQSMENPL